MAERNSSLRGLAEQHFLELATWCSDIQTLIENAMDRIETARAAHVSDTDRNEVVSRELDALGTQFRRIDEFTSGTESLLRKMEDTEDSEDREAVGYILYDIKRLGEESRALYTQAQSAILSKETAAIQAASYAANELREEALIAARKRAPSPRPLRQQRSRGETLQEDVDPMGNRDPPRFRPSILSRR